MEQELDFGFRTVIKLFEIDGVPVGFTTTHINTWIVMAILITIALIIRLKLPTFTDVPTTRFQNVVETLVESLSTLVETAMGERHKKRFTPFYGSMFLFILLCNLLGFLGLRPPTADIATTFALSMTTFVMIQGFAIANKKWGYVKGFFEPVAPFVILNVFGELANPISLGFRLFGNLMGGTVIMGLFYAAIPNFLKLGFPSILHIYFDVFSAIMQSFIFVMLSMTFVSGSFE